MSDDDELKLVAEIERAIGKPSHVDMNEAFSARMRAAIEAELESASIGIVTTLEPKSQNTWAEEIFPSQPRVPLCLPSLFP
jgi:hypothetical protein